MPKKILVADDSPTVRNVMESLLRKHGYEVFFAEDGAKTLEVAQARKPDLIFLDDSLSVVNSNQVCEKLKRIESLKDIPIVIYLPVDEKEREQELKQAGADAFIGKPFNPKEILDYVKSVFRPEKIFSSEDEQRITEDLPPREDDALPKKETQKASSIQKEKSKDNLDIVETSDLLEEIDPSASGEKVVHGFDWFMSELKKEAKGEKTSSHPAKKPVISGKVPKHKKENKVYKIDEDQKGYEDFLKELKQEVEEPGEEKSISVKSLTTEDINWSQLALQFLDLKEKISQRVAKEVAKKISPEFLEKVIREEMSKISKDSS
jgi:CheY-like chemotaxis protein